MKTGPPPTDKKKLMMAKALLHALELVGLNRKEINHNARDLAELKPTAIRPEPGVLARYGSDIMEAQFTVRNLDTILTGKSWPRETTLREFAELFVTIASHKAAREGRELPLGTKHPAVKMQVTHIENLLLGYRDHLETVADSQ